MKASQPLNEIRSATAPAMRAGVMMANLPWNMAKAYSGPPAGRIVWSMPRSRKSFESQPKNSASPGTMSSTRVVEVSIQAVVPESFTGPVPWASSGNAVNRAAKNPRHRSRSWAPPWFVSGMPASYLPRGLPPPPGTTLPGIR